MSQDVAPPWTSPRRLAGWVTLAAAGWAVFELTRSPALGSVLIALKFAWEDFRSAVWLWRRDPLPWRRRATASLYLAWGLCKTGAVAFLMSFIFLLFMARNAAPVQAEAITLGTISTTAVAFLLSTLLMTLAIGIAWFAGLKLWLDGGVRRARRHDFWPPTPFCQGRNCPLAALTYSSMAATVPLYVVSVGVAFQFFPRVIRVLPALLLAAPVLLLVLGSLVNADRPEDCWQEDW